MYNCTQQKMKKSPALLRDGTLLSNLSGNTLQQTIQQPTSMCYWKL